MHTSMKLVVAGLSALALTATVQAGQLVQFSAGPISPALPEFVFSNAATPRFLAGPGSVGSNPGDGLLDSSLQQPGGLTLQTPLAVAGTGAKSLANGGTEFDDVTMVISNLAASGPAVTSTIGGTTLIAQPLGASGGTPTISFYSTDLDGPSGPIQPTLLLQATLTDATLTAINGSTAASVLSAGLTYQPSAILTALQAAGGDASNGDLSLDLIDSFDILNNQGFLSINPTTGFFVPFAAQGGGSLNSPSLPSGGPIVPEPASVSLLAAGAVGLIARRRRHA